MNYQLIFYVAIIFPFFVAAESTTTTLSEKIKVGVLVPLTGDSAPGQGQYVRQGIELAHSQQVNPRIDLIFEDSRCQRKAVLSSAQKLVSVDRVSMIIGDVCWTHVIAPITEKEKIIVIAPGSAQSSVREAGDFIFRLKLDVSVDSRELARVLRSKFKAQKVSIFSVDDEWGEGIARNFQEEFLQNGGIITSRQSFLQNERDFRSLLLKVRASEPEFLVIGAFPAQVGIIAKQVRELGMNIKLAAYGGSIDTETLQIGGESLNGLIFLEEYFLNSTDLRMRKFRMAFNNTFDKEPNLFAALGYDAYMLLNKITLDCGVNTECIRDKLYETSNHRGASGTITFDEKGDVQKISRLRMIQDSQFVDYE